MFECLNRWLEHVPGRLRLRDKACLIVGAGSDVTAMIARVFAAEGCRILAIDENEQAIRELVDLIQEEGGWAVSCRATTRSVEDLERCLSNRRFRQPDILIDNWSVRRPQGPERFDFCPNSLGVLVARTSDVIFDGRRREFGSIVIDTSLAPSFTRILARDNVPNRIRVNTVCFSHEPRSSSPKHISSDLAETAVEHRSAVDQRSLMQIAYAALFLASDEASFVDGTSISIDDDEINNNSLIG